MNQEEIQQAALDEALVATNDRVLIGSCNMRIDPNKTQRESTYQVILNNLKLSPCYNAFLITTNPLKIYMRAFWFTVTKSKKSFLLSCFNLMIQNFNCIFIGNLHQTTRLQGISGYDLRYNSKAYQTYLVLSTGTKTPRKVRGKGKDLMSKKVATHALEKKKKSVPTKKGSITIEENILFDPDEALYLVIGGEQASKVDKEAVERQKKEKMKGIATDAAAQELLNLKKGTRKSI
ncbi:hypothetical protein Tco_1080202 [Tanacetum coccineum]|uniref:Uncharacterized protein n=1 Tax=Tanacetum coccineum TaxID=301880 RepID=A0ABQ5HVT4_9ASTR